MSAVVSSLLRATALPLALALLAACPSPPRAEAPEDLEGLARFFFTDQLTASDEELDEAIGNAQTVLSDLLDGEPHKVGALKLLDEEALEAAEVSGGDPSLAPGMFLVKRFRCELGVLAEILTHPDQPAVHPGVYDSYERDFDDDRDAWLDGGEGVLRWKVTYEATPTATQYRAKTRSGVRHVPKVESSVGPSLVQRTVLREPATFVGEPDNHVFDQDYQSEVFIDVGDGEVLHFYSLWRFMQLGIVSIHDDVFVDFQLDGMIQWDDQTEAACATWPELP